MDKRPSWHNGKLERMGNIMFEFRIIVCADGMEIIDTSLKTPYESLTPLQMTEYSEVADQISYMEMLRRRAQRQKEQQRKLARNPLYRIANVFGIL